MTLLNISGLTTGYGSATNVLHQIDLQVAEGTAVGVIGANGAGKSTLLRVLAGLQSLRGGTIELQGEKLPAESSAARMRRGLVMLPEGHRVLRNLTVEENLRLAAISVWPRGVKGRLAEALPTVHELFPILLERRRQLAGLLSGGEQQMVSIARALISQPKVLLLDEPSLGLAPIVIDRIYESLGQLRATGLSMLIVEQDYTRLNRLCDQMHVLRLGQIRLSADGALEDEEAIQSAYFGHAQK
jgi:branched-chain amino acid transport system ATP-binding protein